MLSTKVRIDGEYVAYAVQAAGDPGYSVATVLVVNARTGHAREVEPHETESHESFIEDVGVAADGAVVYLESAGSTCPGAHMLKDGEIVVPDALVEATPSGEQHTLECELASEPEGSISELTVSNRTATWVHAGVTHTALLG